MKLTRNALQCLKCNDIIESKHQHDFKFCSCGSVFVDGGLTYTRRGGNKENIKDLREWEEDDE